MDNDLRKRVFNFALEKRYEVSKYDSAILELYQNYIGIKKTGADFDIEKIKSDFYNFILNIPANEKYTTLLSANSPYIWGLQPDNKKSEKISNAVLENKELIFGEEGFLRSICSMAQLVSDNKKHYQYALSYLLDDLTPYFDATRASRMELILNSGFKINDEEILRVKKIIKKILDNKISKYNSQPDLELNIGNNSKKVLVIDQSWRDYSILKGLADDKTFETMLDCAIKENKDADIIIKTHPDAIGKDSVKPKCYYQNFKPHDNIYRITDAINPISLINYADKIYVCSSQFGFEALMAKKEVHTFGMPFYAGWGLTIDNQKCERRSRTRTLEEIFYVAYIYLAAYINPVENRKIEIEDAIDFLIKQRKNYFDEIEAKVQI